MRFFGFFIVMEKLTSADKSIDDIKTLYGIQLNEHGYGWPGMSEDKIRGNFDVIIQRLSLLTKAPNLFLQESKKNQDSVIYAISRTPFADREDEPHIRLEDFEKNAALSVCGTLRMNIDEKESWHTEKNRARVEWNGWETNPADKSQPIFPYYGIREE